MENIYMQKQTVLLNKKQSTLFIFKSINSFIKRFQLNSLCRLNRKL